jgi:TM2 domain-containing membrane protein YozV
MSRRAKAILLALFLGGIGIHKFYLNKVGQGVLFLLFFWTLIPALIALIDVIRFAMMSNEEFDKAYPTYVPAK